MNWTTYLEEHQTEYVRDLCEFLRIPSVSQVKTEVTKAAEWVAERLHKIGFEHVQVYETKGNSVVYGDWLHAPDKPTVILYAHYDVQPADPLDLWTTPPFEPTIRDGRIYARGSGDMKGNLLLQLIACEALLKTTGALPVNVKVVYEGEEEIGSPSLPEFIADHREMLQADCVLDSDTGIDLERPSILAGCRGAAELEIHVKSANRDVHAGLFGGAYPNAAQALSHILASLHNDEGKVLIPGFYNHVDDITDDIRPWVTATPEEEQAILRNGDVKSFVGEREFTPHERSRLRPALIIAGITSGYQGEGVKGIIPSEAHAKIQLRLVASQSPEESCRSVIDHVLQNTPAEVDVTVDVLPGAVRAYKAPMDHPLLKWNAEFLTSLTSKSPVYRFIGGTLPVTVVFQDGLGLCTASIGFGGENFHAPDEWMSLEHFQTGQSVWCQILESIRDLKV
jgi:acetylornithine deacetylase/succinyl-diaminopimelate desuccinylase-like protein